MEILRKITIKTCGNFTIARVREVMEAAKLKDGESVPLLRVVGTAAGAKSGQTALGTFTKLAGQFVGTDLTTGAVYQSGQCILPEFVGAQLGAALLGAGGQADAKGVDFAFEITAKKDDKSVSGYTYGVKPLIETKPSDRMADLMAKAGIVLPAPSVTPALPGAGAPAEPAAAKSGKGK